MSHSISQSERNSNTSLPPIRGPLSTLDTNNSGVDKMNKRAKTNSIVKNLSLALAKKLE